MLHVLLILPPSPQCQALVPPRKSWQRQEQDGKFRVPLHYCAEGLALQCFLVLLALDALELLASLRCQFVACIYCKHRQRDRPGTIATSYLMGTWRYFSLDVCMDCGCAYSPTVSCVGLFHSIASFFCCYG